MAARQGVALIAGGGLAGLAAAASLARADWETHLYERSNQIREFGAGIYLKENCIRALEQLGAWKEVSDAGVRLTSHTQILKNGTRYRHEVGAERYYNVRREDLHTALLRRAQDAGAELHVAAEVAGAAPSGVLRFADGTERRGDLVIGADGIGSRVRESLGLTKWRKTLGSAGLRLLVPRQETPEELAGESLEFWGDRTRAMQVPCSADWTYVGLSGPAKNPVVMARELDLDFWKSEIPAARSVIERADGFTPTVHQFAAVRCHTWASGRVIVMGDAAHAQPPNLGQGAGLAIANAVDLASSIADRQTVATDLAEWETKRRRLATQVQRFSMNYGAIVDHWPASLISIRAPILKSALGFSPVAKHYHYLFRGGVEMET